MATCDGHHDSLGGLGIGFLLGAVVGIAVGMLYAPRPGEETRAMLYDKADEVREKVGEAVDIVKHKVSAIHHPVSAEQEG